ncbi:MAG: lysophospholipid acyltransferase family protein [Cytophagaceae bacterium]|jgi:KDO2-lipid IV(A) lauroyltransferase|nr:lysophospholipid acyltransferase family protein [Cytophagaceae bacterium]
MKSKITFKQIRRGIKYPVLVFFIKLFIATVRFFPRRWTLFIFGALGKLSFRVVANERKKTIKNITIAFGDTMSHVEIKRMAKQVFVNMALIFADYLHTLHYTTRRQFDKIIDFEGVEHLEKAYAEGRGVLCLTGHTSSWEFSAIMPPILGFDTTAVSRRMPNERINRLIVGFRQKRGMKNIGRGNAYPKLLEALAKGECMIIMVDQDTQAKGVFIDFFGKSAYTPVGAARLALDTKVPVVPMFMRRYPNNRYKFTIHPPLPLIDTSDTAHDLLENTRIYTAIYEKVIREAPDQWVWMHERWKTTPEDIERFLARRKAEKEATMS